MSRRLTQHWTLYCPTHDPVEDRDSVKVTMSGPQLNGLIKMAGEAVAIGDGLVFRLTGRMERTDPPPGHDRRTAQETILEILHGATKWISTPDMIKLMKAHGYAEWTTKQMLPRMRRQGLLRRQFKRQTAYWRPRTPNSR